MSEIDRCFVVLGEARWSVLVMAAALSSGVSSADDCSDWYELSSAADARDNPRAISRDMGKERHAALRHGIAPLPHKTAWPANPHQGSVRVR